MGKKCRCTDFSASAPETHYLNLNYEKLSFLYKPPVIKEKLSFAKNLDAKPS